MSEKSAISSQTSHALRALSFLCACLVVPIHCWSPSAWLNGTSTLRPWEAAISFLFTDTLSRCAVPCFFVMSGFFLALKYEPTFAWYKKTLRKRFFTLYVPFVIWNVFYLIRNSLLAHHSLFTLNGVFGYNLFVAPGFGMFWFMQVIIVGVILSPLWLPLLRNRWTGLAALLFLLLGWLMGLPGHYFSPQLAYSNFLWLFLGAFAAFNFDRTKTPPNCIRLPIALVLVLCIAGHVLIGISGHSELMCVTGKLIIMAGVFSLFAFARQIDRLLMPFAAVYTLSFFIYALHPQGLLVHIPLECIGAPFIVTYVVRILCGIALPILLGLCMRRYTPGVFALLTGARGR